MGFLKATALTVFALSATPALSRTWIAICEGGKNLQYNQTENGTGFLYLKVKDSNNRTHTYQVARLEQTFYNGTAICGTVLENGSGQDGTPITQVCANKSRRTIYVKYKHPHDSSLPITSGVFCRARVWAR